MVVLLAFESLELKLMAIVG